MKKVGMITLYYNNINYGGLLQAYALTRYICSLGFDAEQISTDFISGDDSKLLYCGNGIKSLIKKPVKTLIYKLNRGNFRIRRSAFKTFEKSIPHSNVVYNQHNIEDACKEYDIFVTGSDQVWNMTWYQPAYFLSFVKNKTKISYAASMPGELNTRQKELVADHLSGFTAISVREQSMVDIIGALSHQDVFQAVDPTLLLGRKEWDEILDDRVVNEPYLFCYFLSSTLEIKQKTREFSKKKKIKIVTFPHVGGINIADCFFGDIRLYDVSPSRFLALIRHADYVMTDSFHAAVFSNIFEKKFVVFSRSGGESMNTRLSTMLDLFDANERFIGPGMTFAEIEAKIDMDTACDKEKVKRVIENSELFLKKYLIMD